MLYNESTPNSPCNIVNPDQLKMLVDELQDINNESLFIVIDQEGGEMARLKPQQGFYTLPSAKYLGELNQYDTSLYYARLNALQLSDLGINVNLAPCVDLYLSPNNPIIGQRSYSDNPLRVIEEAEIVINQYHRKNILTSLKHFPGHGSSKGKTVHGLVDISESFNEDELIPYRELVKRRNVDIIMVSHLFNKNIDPVYPSSLSQRTIDSLLRKDIGFDGVVLIDNMHLDSIIKDYDFKQSVELAINAGADMIILGNNAKLYHDDLIDKSVATISELVEQGKIPLERINESYERVIRLKKQLKK